MKADRLIVKLQNQTELAAHPGWLECVAETHEQMRDLAAQILHLDPSRLADPAVVHWIGYALSRYQALEAIVGPETPSPYDLTKSLPATLIDRYNAELNTATEEAIDV